MPVYSDTILLVFRLFIIAESAIGVDGTVDTAKVSESLSLQRVEVTVMVIDSYGGGGISAVRQ
jgi:hypothetical protein